MHKHLTVIIAAIALWSCSSIGARTSERSYMHQPYNGLDYALHNAGECFVVTLLGAPPLLLLYLPITAIDIAASTLVDTVLYPIDAIRADERYKDYDGPNKGPCTVKWSP